MKWDGLDEEYNELDDPSFIGLSSPSQTVSGRRSKIRPGLSQCTKLPAFTASSSRKKETVKRQRPSSTSLRPSGRGSGPNIGSKRSKLPTAMEEVGLKIKLNPELKARFHAWAIQHGTTMTTLIKGFIEDTLKAG